MKIELTIPRTDGAIGDVVDVSDAEGKRMIDAGHGKMPTAGKKAETTVKVAKKPETRSKKPAAKKPAKNKKASK